MPSQLTATLAAHEQKLLACVHCGLCLEACPTYVLTGDENDGPRGRIYLMRAVEEERLERDSPSFKLHIDRCLGCRACEPVCPAGVQYGDLLEASRAELFNSGVTRKLIEKLLRFALRHVWLHENRLKFAFATARVIRDAGIARVLLKSRIPRLISRRLEFGLALLENSSPEFTIGSRNSSSIDSHFSDSRPSRDSTPVLLFKGCVGEGLFARVNEATVRVLEVNGFKSSAPPGQVCCGALHAHAGDLEGARHLARQNINAFEALPETPIITNAGGCGAMLIAYAHLLSGDEVFSERAHKFTARVRDVSQQLENCRLKTGAEFGPETVTYDASCHLINGQHAGDAPLRLLRAIPNLKFVPLEGSERCCGAAGVYNLLEPNMSKGVLKEKLSHLQETGARIVATGNAGCQMQIGAGAKLDGVTLHTCHPVELLDESYERAGLYEKTRQTR